MSLEAKIELLTAAVVELTRVMQSQSAFAAQQKAVQTMWDANTVSQTRVADTATVEISEEPKEVPNAETKPSPITDTSPPSSQASVTYDDVKNVTIAVSKTDKSKAVAGLARFGVTTAKALNESQWSDYVVYMKRVAAGEVDPEASHES